MSTIKIKAPAMPEPAHRGPSGTGDYFNSFTPQQLAYRDTQWQEMYGPVVEALAKARQDINWMLNSQQFLSGFVFDYIDKALSAITEE